MDQSNFRLKPAVTGACGRMGRLLIEHLASLPNCEILGATERPDHPDIGKDVGLLFLGRPSGLLLENDLRNVILGVNVVIDFTSPDASLLTATLCAERNIPLVCGTTGMTPEQRTRFCGIAGKTRCVFSPNFSTGIALLGALAERAAATIGEDSDIEIVETHHRNKVDAPSGTALALARAVAEPLGLSDADFEFGREGQCGPRKSGRIGVHAVRGGDIVGDHEIHFLADGEKITVAHRATSRNAFVRGAVRAARWLQDKEPGLYTMRDVLGLF